ncbi:hypothetical protein B0H14DRAFT_3138465 [Mycena olivaceomarginata]|nr:hypothetical protein B0H14DRAFT_3138465 [Mycena olivaceomarginata]
MKKPVNEKYIHRLVTMPDGGVMILTCLAALMKLLDDTGVTSFETDTTFRRIVGDINEWEVVLFLKALQRAVTIARGYVNGASAAFFERLFDEFQAVKLEITQKPVAFKRFVEGGNIIAMNSDTEAAQVLGAARSFFKTNDAEYSGLPENTPGEEVAPEMIKLCTTHAKRGILDLKSHVSEEDHRRLMDFILGVKKVQDWWDHKAMSPWSLPCLIKSQSPMSPEDWDNTPSTTNTGEAQHHWTNHQIGVKQSLVEAIENARKLDERVAREIEISIRSGVRINSQNESYNRRARNTTRQSTAMRKSHASHQLADERAEIELEIEALRAEKQDSAARLKALQTRKSEIRKKSETGTSSGTRTVVVSASSSGRVKTRTINSIHPVASTSAAPPLSNYATMGDVFDPDSAGTHFPAVSALVHHPFAELDDILYLPAASKIDDICDGIKRKQKQRLARTNTLCGAVCAFSTRQGRRARIAAHTGAPRGPTVGSSTCFSSTDAVATQALLKRRSQGGHFTLLNLRSFAHLPRVHLRTTGNSNTLR